MAKKLIDIGGYDDAGYKVLTRYGEWRVAVLNYIDELDPSNITFVQAHEETDEVFVLLRGRCTLFLAARPDDDLTPCPMEPLKAYNVKRGVWHTHVLSKDGSVLIVENRDTANPNSPKAKLSGRQRDQIESIGRPLLA